MKRLCSPGVAVSVLFVLLTLSAVGVSAQSFEWNNPQTVVTDPVGGHITALAVDPVTETVYGIDGASTPTRIVTITGAEVTETQDAEAGDVSPVVALAADPHGVLYAVSATAVSTCSAGVCTAVTTQPKLPANVATNATYKDIAIGKGGKIYVLLECDTAQYLLIGYPPAMTEGVAVSISPVVLNMASKGNWVNAMVTAPEGYDADEILPESVKIVWVQGTGPSGAIDQAVDISIAAGAPYGVKKEKLHLKFPRYNKQDPASPQSLVGFLTTLLPSTDAKGVYNLILTIEGQLESGEYFAGTAPLTVLVPKAKVVKPKKEKP